MEKRPQAAPNSEAAPRVPPSPAIQAEYWGEPEEVRARLTAEAPRDVLDYWMRLRGSRRFPSRADFDPMEMRRHLANIFMLDVLPEGIFRYRVVGTLISDFFGVGNPAGMTPQDVFGANAEVALSPLRICTAERLPYLHTASASWIHRDRNYVYYEALLLPLGDSDEEVNKVLCCAEFVTEEEAARM